MIENNGVPVFDLKIGMIRSSRRNCKKLETAPGVPIAKKERGKLLFSDFPLISQPDHFHFPHCFW